VATTTKRRTQSSSISQAACDWSSFIDWVIDQRNTLVSPCFRRPISEPYVSPTVFQRSRKRIGALRSR
jgi:hypothetical protein